MCCGRKVVESRSAAKSTVPTWQVIDGSGKVVTTKTTEISAKLAAARIAGGRVKKVST